MFLIPCKTEVYKYDQGQCLAAKTTEAKVFLTL